jgi:hypothetical protein
MVHVHQHSQYCAHPRCALHSSRPCAFGCLRSVICACNNAWIALNLLRIDADWLCWTACARSLRAKCHGQAHATSGTSSTSSACVGTSLPRRWHLSQCLKRQRPQIALHSEHADPPGRLVFGVVFYISQFCLISCLQCLYYTDASVAPLSAILAEYME